MALARRRVPAHMNVAPSRERGLLGVGRMGPKETDLLGRIRATLWYALLAENHASQCQTG